MAHLGTRLANLEPGAHNPQVAGSSPATATNSLETNLHSVLGDGNPSVRQVPLSRGMFAIVDAADFPKLFGHKWYAVRRHRNFYAETKINGKPVLMHIFLIGKRRGFVTDHINGDGLDNRRCNLRFATHLQNMANRKRAIHSKSGFKGVHQDQYGGFVAAARKNGEYHYAGYFHSAKEAALAYDAKAKEIHGEFARLNFPKEFSNG